jgi:energy-coupling factor transporter ATP-binding protein EcfA2
MSQAELLGRLKSDIDAGRVTVITGTGVSIPTVKDQLIGNYNVATWPGLLKHGIEYCQAIGLADDFDVSMLTTQVDSGRIDYMISAAETITKKLRSKSAGTYRGWLKKTIGELKVADNTLIKAIAGLPIVLATLNYDNLLEDVTGKRTVMWTQADAVQDVITGADQNSIIHLHGWYGEPDTVVLGIESYLTVRDNLHAKALLQHFTIGRTLLFIGCGGTFEDPNFSQLLEWAKTALEDVSPRHYLLCRTSELSDFQKKLSNAPWLQPLAFGSNYGDIVPFIKSLYTAESYVLPATKVLSSHELEEYRKAMFTRYRRLKLEQLDSTTHDIRHLTLNAMYVEPRAKECIGFVPRVFELPKELQLKLRKKGELDSKELDHSIIDQYRRAYVEQESRLLSAILSDESCSKLVILGDPGSGKSTLLQHLVLEWAELSSVKSDDSVLPILIELREFAVFAEQNKSDDLFAYLGGGAGMRWHFEKEMLTHWLSSRKSLLLFDGLDEIFDLSLRKKITTAVHRFAHEFPLAKILVTSRVVGYQHQAWNDEGFRHFMLQDLDQDQIEFFLKKWHELAYEETDLGKKKEELLRGAISSSTAIKQLAGNPLLLTMMAVLNRTQDLPRDRAELYEQCARLLLHQWKIDVTFHTDPDLAKASLDFKDKRGLLLQVARAMHSGAHGLAGNLIEEETLETTLAVGLNEIRIAVPNRAARSLIEQLQGRNFMLCFMGGRSYAFVHRTFLEYFCAAEIAARFEKERTLTLEQLQKEIFIHWPDETWKEVLCLLAGMISGRFTEQVIQWLIRQPDPRGTLKNVLLALNCFSEVRNRSVLNKTEPHLRRIVKNLSLFETPFDSKFFGDKGGEAVDAVKIAALGLMSVVWPDSADNIVWFKRIISSEASWTVRAKAMELLARDWKDDAQIVGWIKEQAQAPYPGQSRAIAMAELASNWPLDPDVRDIAERTFSTDKDETARATALTVIGRLEKDDAKYLGYLEHVIRTDKGKYVPFIAMHELGRRSNQSEHSFELIAALLKNKKYNQKYYLIEILSTFWRDNEKTLPLIFEFIESESDVAVKNVAQEQVLSSFKDVAAAQMLARDLLLGEASLDLKLLSMAVLSEYSLKGLDLRKILMSIISSDNDAKLQVGAIKNLQKWSKNSEVFEMVKAVVESLDRSSDVRSEAARFLAKLPNRTAKVTQLLHDLLVNDADISVRKAIIDALSASKKQQSETISLIRQLALEEKNPDVRARAVRAFANLSKNDLGLTEVLEASISPKQNYAVRFMAAAAMAAICQEFRGSVTLLKSLAKNDKNSTIRLLAVSEISRRASEDDEVIDILKSTVIEDRSKDVRLRAVRELARRWPEDVQVRTLLTNIQKKDVNNRVRETAAAELERIKEEDLLYVES